MKISERQSDILNNLIKDYIQIARPISSEFLEKKHSFGLSPATLRIEMQKLTDKGFLSQPHTAAGRVPTDKGYRFFVNELLETLRQAQGRENKPVQEERQYEDSFEFIKTATRFLAEGSSELALGYSAGQKIIWKEGWQDIFDEPEFSEPGLAASFAKMLEDFEDNIEEVFSSETKIYIGKENPVSKSKDFSIITSGFKGGFFAILGPKRMSYDKNIELFKKLWEKI